MLTALGLDDRLSAATAKTTLAIFGAIGVGKTSLLKTLPAGQTLCLDLEAGLNAVPDWPGVSIPIRTFGDALGVACLVGGVDPAAPENGVFGQGHYDYLAGRYPELVEIIAARRIVFVDSITDLTRQGLTWAQQQPEAFSEKTGHADPRGAYGLLARMTIRCLKHLQHAAGKTTVFVGILEAQTDEVGRTSWGPQMDGGKAARELPGIVDQVISMARFSAGKDGALRHDPENGELRRLVCRQPNGFGLPAKDRSGRLETLEPADLGALLAKIHGGH